MTFQGQGTPPDPSGQAVPAPQDKQQKSSGGFRQMIEDNYNGLYKIVLKPRMPEGILYAIGIIALFVGIFWAYTVAGVQWTDGNPNRLNDGSQRQWLLMTAVGNINQSYSPEQVAQLAQAIPNPRALAESMLSTDENLSQTDQIALQTLLNTLPADIDTNSAPVVAPRGLLNDLLWVILIPLIILIILIVIIVLIWRFFIYDNFVAPLQGRIAEMRDPELAARNREKREELKIMQQQRALRAQLAAESTGSQFGDPVMTQLAIYSPGRNFDESYEIELESGDFLGQSGAVIAEAVDPDPVAIEVWLFDMFTSRNIAKIFVTPQGNADPAIRSRLEASVDNPATDIMVAAVGTPLYIDTDKLQLEAKFSTLDINANGRFENFNLQMRAWNKESASAATVPAPPTPTPAGAPPMSAYDDIQFDPPPTAPPTPAGAPPMSTYDNIQFDPPPTPPSGGYNPSPPPPTTNTGYQPLQPPPLNPSIGTNDTASDDPFGGTGDFTPLGS